MSPDLEWFMPRKLIKQIVLGVASCASFPHHPHERECASKTSGVHKLIVVWFFLAGAE
jgi:hypothetical protein